jgi:amino acid transporter
VTEGGVARQHLVRQIGLWSGVAVVVGSTIGSGIFKSPAAIAERVPGPVPMLLVWIVGGLFVLCGALALAEVGGAFPYSGGHYVFIREAYGRFFSFLFGWAQLILIRPSAIGAVALVFGQYALRLTGASPDNPTFALNSLWLALGAIGIVTVANVRGVKFGTALQNLTTVAKTGGLLAMIVLALAIGLPQSGGNFTPAMPEGSFSLSMFGLALVSALWAYDGWADATFVGGEMLSPRRNVPRAILIGTGIIIAVYLLANVAYLAVLSVAEMAKSQIIAADTMERLVGAGGIAFIIGVVMISTFGTLNGSLLTSPRIFFAMAEDRMLFGPLARVHPRYKTPHVSVLLSCALGASYAIVATLFAGSDAFTTLTDAFVIGIVPFYALSVGSIFVFRKREKAAAMLPPLPDESEDSLIDPIESDHPKAHPHRYSPSTRALFYPVTPILFIASTVFLIANAMIDESSRTASLIAIGAVLAGSPVYALLFRTRRTND